MMFCFFKQKTAYEMRISDWSSDVCSSDLTSLLIELGTEELPVKALPGLAQALFEGVVDALGKRGIAVERGEAKPLYSPRRLAVLLPSVAVEQPEQASEVLGPYLNIALDARSEEHTSELQSLMRNSYAVFCLKKKKQ